MNGELFGGKYTVEEVQRIMNINARPTSLLKPLNPLYKKTATEHAPTWQEKSEVSIPIGHRIDIVFWDLCLTQNLFLI